MPDFSPDDLPLRARLTVGTRHALMTAVAAWTSYATTSLLGLHEGFWATISSIVVMQSDWTATESSARDRFIGTAMGGMIGWLCAVYWHQHSWIYVVAIALTIFSCWIARVSTAGRLAAVTVTVIVLIPRAEPIWKIALFRFLEVSWGIAVAVAVQWTVSWALRRLSKSKRPP